MSLEQAISYALEVIATAPSVVPKAAPAEPWIDLTPRERVVAQLIARGLTNRQIAAELGIADRTADTHVSHLLRKLGVASRLDVAAMSEQLSDIAAPR
jgi:non-specific serine/threonine protein kinase